MRWACSAANVDVNAAPKKDIPIHLDADIVDWFKTRGRCYQTRINAVLRAFVRSR